MIESLFDLPESKSPRVLWMEKHGVKTYPPSPVLGCWAAARECDPPLDEFVGLGDTELDALTDLARKINLRLWNEP
jgi:hypothetical protein